MSIDAPTPPVTQVVIDGGVMMRRFESKIVLITGATSGIGRATAIAFAREGAQVLLAGNTASKWGGVGMTKAAALEYAAQNIRINGLCPGVVATDMAQRCSVHDGVFDPKVIAAHPLGGGATAG